MVNIGFSVATILTAAGLVMLSASLEVTDSQRAGLVAVAVTYAIAGVLWCAVLAIRTRTTPLLGDLVAAGTETEPAEGLVGAAIGGLFSAFALMTSIALVVLGLILAVGAGVAIPAGWSAVVIGAIGIAAIWRSGDLIPAVLYLPTLVLGISLLLGAA